MGKRADKNTGGAAGKVVETTTRTREVLPETGGELDLGVDPIADADDDALAKLDELEPGMGARYEVRRTSPSEFAGYVGTYSREELSPDAIYSDWGGGRYNIRVRNAKGQMLGSAPLVIAGKSKHKMEAQAAPIAAAQAAAPAVDQAGMVRAVTDSMKPTIDMLSRLVEALITRPAPTPPAGPDPLEVLEKAANILKPRGGEGDSIKLFMQGVEMAQRFGGEGGEPSMASVFLKGVETIKDVATMQNANAPRRPAQARLPAPGAPAAAPVATNHPEKPVLTDQMKQVQWIKQQVAFLLVQAKREKNAELYAELFVDNLPDFLPEATVAEQMQRADAVDRLAFLIPDVATYKPWFEEFRKHVLGFIAQGQDPGLETGGDPPPDDDLPGGSPEGGGHE